MTAANRLGDMCMARDNKGMARIYKLPYDEWRTADKGMARNDDRGREHTLQIVTTMGGRRRRDDTGRAGVGEDDDNDGNNDDNDDDDDPSEPRIRRFKSQRQRQGPY